MRLDMMNIYAITNSSKVLPSSQIPLRVPCNSIYAQASKANLPKNGRVWGNKKIQYKDVSQLDDCDLISSSNTSYVNSDLTIQDDIPGTQWSLVITMSVHSVYCHIDI